MSEMTADHLRGRVEDALADMRATGESFDDVVIECFDALATRLAAVEGAARDVCNFVENNPSIAVPVSLNAHVKRLRQALAAAPQPGTGGGRGMSKPDPWIDAAKDWLYTNGGLTEEQVSGSNLIEHVAELLADYNLCNEHHQALRTEYNRLLVEQECAYIAGELGDHLHSEMAEPNGSGQVVYKRNGMTVTLSVGVSYTGVYPGWKRKSDD